MAIINHSYKFIFVHIPKAAGTSITSCLSAYTHYNDLEIGGTQYGERIQEVYSPRFGIYKHSPAYVIRDVIGAEAWSNFYTFSFVRHPFTRFLSAFRFLRQWADAPQQFRNYIRSFNDINAFVEDAFWKQKSGPDSMFLPQCHWLTERDDRSRMLVRKVFRIEELRSSLIQIEQDLNIKLNDLSLKNASQPEDRINYTLSASSRSVLKEIYRRDFERFGYSDDM